jgi:hypothetical protein
MGFAGAGFAPAQRSLAWESERWKTDRLLPESREGYFDRLNRAKKVPSPSLRTHLVDQNSASSNRRSAG